MTAIIGNIPPPPEWWGVGGGGRCSPSSMLPGCAGCGYVLQSPVGYGGYPDLGSQIGRLCDQLAALIVATNRLADVLTFRE